MADILKCDIGTADDSVSFQAYVKTKAYILGEDISKLEQPREPILRAEAEDDSTVYITYDREFGRETRTASCDLSPAASEYRVSRKGEGLDLADISVLQVQVGDVGLTGDAWALERVDVPVKSDGRR